MSTIFEVSQFCLVSPKSFGEFDKFVLEFDSAVKFCNSFLN